jgi:hypothetical protein
MVGTAVAATLAYFGCKRQVTSQSSALYLPHFLSILMDKSAIEEIGKSDLKKHPEENSIEKLKSNILSSFDGNSLAQKETGGSIDKFFESKILSEFRNGNQEVIDGWVLSVTEARQCALFTVLNKS